MTRKLCSPHGPPTEVVVARHPRLGLQDRRSHALDERGPGSCGGPSTVERGARRSRQGIEAEAFRGELIFAKRLREPFDRGDRRARCRGRRRLAETKIHTWARRWLGEQWPEWQPRTRKSAVEALTRFVPSGLHQPCRRGRRTDIRAYLATTLVPEASVDTDDPCERWLDESMHTLVALNRDLLARVDSQLGSASGGTCFRRRRRAGTARSPGRACDGHSNWTSSIEIRGRRHRRAGGTARRPGYARPSTCGCYPSPPRWSVPSKPSSLISLAAGRTG